MTNYIGNKPYTEMNPNNRRFINGTQEEITALADELSKENISFSGRIGWKNTITVDTDENYSKALDLIYNIRRNNEKSNNSNTQIIGNTAFKYFARNDRAVLTDDTAVMKAVARKLDDNKIRYSGVIVADKTKITVSSSDVGYLKSIINVEKNNEMISQLNEMNFEVSVISDGIFKVHNTILNSEKEYFSIEELKSDVDNKDDFLFPTAFKIELTSDAYNENYYISVYNPNTLEEKAMLSDVDGWTLTFSTVDEALNYVDENNINIDNSSKQLREWMEIEKEKAKEENILLAQEYIQNIDQSEDHFVFNDNDTITWSYYNPDGNGGNGQFVISTITNDDIEEAYKYKKSAETKEKENELFFEYLYSACYTELVDVGTNEFVQYAQTFLSEAMDDRENIVIADVLNNPSDIVARLENMVDISDLEEQIEPVSEELTSLNNQIAELKTALVQSIDTENYYNASEIAEKLASLTRRANEEKNQSPLGTEENKGTNTLTEKEEIKQRTLIVNIYGGPGIGKSTAALQIVAELKKMGYSAEYVSEVAKDYIYAKDFEMLNGKYENQSKLMKEQQSKIDLLIGNVDIVITDSPLILSGAYINEDDKTAKKFVSEVISEYQAYNNYDIVLNRDLSVAFETEGRIHTLEQSVQKDAEITKLLNDNDISFRSYERNDINNIVRGIIEEYTVDNILRECFTNKLSVIVRSRNTDDAMKDMSDMVFTDMFNDENYRIEVAKKYIRSGLFIIPNSAFENDAKDKLNELGIDIGGISLASITQTEEGIILESDNISVSYTWNEVADACLEAAQKYNAKDLSTDEATFEIYQIYEGEKYRDIRFASYDMLESMNETFDRNNYQKVYTGKLSDIHYDNKLKGIYLEFNANHPNDFEGRSVSVSDVIVIKDKNGEKAYYVDSFDYKEIPDFLIEKEVSPLGTEVPEEDSNEEIIDRETIFKSLINAEGIDFVDKLSNMYESEISEACYNKCNEPEVFKQIENKVLELMQNENEPFSNPYYYEGLADEYDAPDEREKISGEIYNCDLLYMTAIADVLELERPKTSADFIYLNDEKVVEEIEDIVENEEKNSHSADEIEIGDKFLYHNRKYTVTSAYGVYPDDVTVSYENIAGNTSYEASTNIDRHTLAEEGIYLGNEKKTEPHILAVGDIIEISDETKKGKQFRVESIIADGLMYNFTNLDEDDPVRSFGHMGRIETLNYSLVMTAEEVQEKEHSAKVKENENIAEGIQKNEEKSTTSEYTERDNISFFDYN